MDLLVSAAAHDDILFVIAGVEPRCEEHLPLPKAPQHLRRIPHVGIYCVILFIVDPAALDKHKSLLVIYGTFGS